MPAKSGGKQNVLYGVIVALLIVIAIMGFFLGKSMGNNDTKINGDETNVNYETVSIKVIKDDGNTLGNITDEFIESLKELPSLQNAEFNIVKFSDAGVKDFMLENDIKVLPAFIFSTKNFNVTNDPVQYDQTGNLIPKINNFLVELPNGEYDLPIGATYDPFVERSERGFRVLDAEQYSLVKEGTYVDGNENTKITWLEFSDLECSFCAKLYNDGTPGTLKDKYGEDLNIIFNHYPLYFHANAQDGAEILECLGEQKGAQAFYALVEKSFNDKKSDKSYLIDEAVKLGANKANLEKCLDDGKYAEKVEAQMGRGYEIFGVTGTPGNIIINNETLEYEEVSGAQPASNFEAVIDRLLMN